VGEPLEIVTGRRIIGVRVREQPLQDRITDRLVVEIVLADHLALQPGEDLVLVVDRVGFVRVVVAEPGGARAARRGARLQEQFDQLADQPAQQTELGRLELADHPIVHPAEREHHSALSSVAHRP